MDIVNSHQNEYFTVSNSIGLNLLDIIGQVIFLVSSYHINDSHMGVWRVIIIVLAK